MNRLQLSLNNYWRAFDAYDIHMTSFDPDRVLYPQRHGLPMFDGYSGITSESTDPWFNQTNAVCFFTRLRSSLLIDRSTKKVQVISWGMFEMASLLGGSSHSAKLSDK